MLKPTEYADTPSSRGADLEPPPKSNPGDGALVDQFLEEIVLHAKRGMVRRVVELSDEMRARFPAYAGPFATESRKSTHHVKG